MKKLTLTIFTTLAMIMGINLAAHADLVSTTTHLTDVSVYANYNGGDVAVVVANPAPGCDNGFYVSPSDPGYKSVLAALLSSLHAKTQVNISGFDTNLWSGSGGKYCHIHGVSVLPQ